MAEWFKAPVLKTGVRATVPGVQIPLHPPFFFSARIKTPLVSSLLAAIHCEKLKALLDATLS